ncbi:heavy-metal-associated domain-containing protein [Flavobacterium humi]|uniref:heavy-metal-associated domain-containing protein n=1 Tax=Flavobacterium humi TaxID=2562683 RepID=UPI00374332DA
MKTEKINNRKIIKHLILVLIMAFAGFSAQAQQANKNAKYAIEVNGNCEQCQKRIQKAALSVPGVKSASWNLETHQLSLILNEEKCSLPDVEKAVAKVGHDTEKVKATDSDYEKLHSCCKYDRK